MLVLAEAVALVLSGVIGGGCAAGGGRVAAVATVLPGLAVDQWLARVLGNCRLIAALCLALLLLSRFSGAVFPLTLPRSFRRGN